MKSVGSAAYFEDSSWTDIEQAASKAWCEPERACDALAAMRGDMSLLVFACGDEDDQDCCKSSGDGHRPLCIDMQAEGTHC
jgi:hypothetical protein